MLQIKDLHVNVQDKTILKGLNLELEQGKIHVIMGPNGSGKSTLANTLMGHPRYEVTQGSITFNNKDITNEEADQRAKDGLFLSFQYPSEVPGVTITNMLRTALNEKREQDIPVPEFMKLIKEKMELLDMKPDFLKRHLNHGFSGGEKKRAEILQLLTLNPQLAILDETDSGLDIDALKVVAQGINAFMGPDKTILLITHYKRILEYIKPDVLHILADGKIVQTGGPELVDQLEEKGYGWIQDD